MPNWVFNELTVSGSAEDLAVFKDEIAKPYTTNHWDYVGSGEAERVWKQREILHESPISFWNALSPTDTDAYFQQPEFSKSNDPAVIGQEMKRNANEGMDWYNWNIRNWGCKWDACNAEIIDISNAIDGSRLHYAFDTPWSIPEPAMIAMSAKYPSLHFLLRSQEEQGWGADIIFSKGCAKLIKEWDVPNSHQDYIDQDRDCWACESVTQNEDGTWDTSDLYDDCPPFDEEEANRAVEEAKQFFLNNSAAKFYISTNLTDALASDTIANGGDAIV